MNHPPFLEHNGKQYTLNHLEDTQIELTLQAHKTNPELELTIQLSYTNHCYTQGTTENSEPHDMEDHNGWPRWFNLERYETSLLLPEFVKQIHKKKCLFTGKQNWLVIELKESSGISVPFYLVFSLWNNKEVENGLHLNIVSAYKKTEGDNAPHRGGSMDRVAFAMLARKTLEGKSVKRPRRR
ncbi:MAG: hypothetical protein QM500_19505 [Methylococcales bacterium]